MRRGIRIYNLSKSKRYRRLPRPSMVAVLDAVGKMPGVMDKILELQAKAYAEMEKAEAEKEG